MLFESASFCLKTLSFDYEHILLKKTLCSYKLVSYRSASSRISQRTALKAMLRVFLMWSTRRPGVDTRMLIPLRSLKRDVSQSVQVFVQPPGYWKLIKDSGKFLRASRTSARNTTTGTSSRPLILPKFFLEPLSRLIRTSLRTSLTFSRYPQHTQGFLKPPHGLLESQQHFWQKGQKGKEDKTRRGGWRGGGKYRD